MNLKQQADARRYGKGTSKAAARRRQVASRGKLHTGKAGDTVQMSDRRYVVDRDGAFRRLV